MLFAQQRTGTTHLVAAVCMVQGHHSCLASRRLQTPDWPPLFTGTSGQTPAFVSKSKAAVIVRQLARGPKTFGGVAVEVIITIAPSASSSLSLSPPC